MKTALRFADIVEAADKLSEDEQRELMDILRKRQVMRQRERLLREVRESQAEHAEGKSRAVTVDELMREFDE